MNPHEVIIKREHSIKEEIDQLLNRADERAKDAGSSEAFAREALKKICDAAGDSHKYGPIKSAIKQGNREFQLWITILNDMLAELEVLEAQRERNKLFTDEWWQQQQPALLAISEKDPAKGLQAWLKVYVQALLAWERETCKKLLEVFPKTYESLADIFRTGTEALLQNRYEESFPMLDHLTHDSSADSTSAVVTTDQAALIHVFKGRIYQKIGDEDSALTQFELARKLAPKFGPPYAGLSNYYLALGSTDQAVAWAQRAVELDPARAEGYVALGLWAESEERIDEADEFYGQAVSKVWSEKNPYVALVALLAPVSGNLLHCLAERLLKERYPEAALVVLDEARDWVAKEAKLAQEPKEIKEVQEDKEDKAHDEFWGLLLRGEILEVLGKREEAFNTYDEAARKLYDLNDSERAIEFFRRANKANPADQPTYWFLMDALRMTTYNMPDPSEVQTALDESLDFWKKGTAISLPDEQYSWAYTGRALVNDQLSTLPGAIRFELWWEGASLVERGILLDEEEAVRWAFLSRFYRYLQLNSNALHASEVALNKNPENQSAMVERCALLANLGMFDEADELVAKLPEDTWAKGVKAYLHLHKERYQDALLLLNSIITESQKELWHLDLRALCYRALNNRAASQDQYHSILETANKMVAVPPSDQGIVASAAYQLGQLDKAINLLTAQLDDPAEADDAYRSLGLCYLMQSDSLKGEEQIAKLKEAKRSIYRGIRMATDVRELDDFLKFELSEFERPSPRWTSNTEGQRKALELIKRRLRKRRKMLEQRLSPSAELRQAFNELISRKQEKGWGLVATQAGIARLTAADNGWVQAGNIYSDLNKDPARFPEARIGLEHCIAELLADGEQQLKTNGVESVEWFKQALALQQEVFDIDKVVNVQLKLGDALLNIDQPAEALTQFNEAQALLFKKFPSLLLGEGNAPLAARAFKWARHLFKGVDNLLARLQQFPDEKTKRQHADLAVRFSFTHFQLSDTETSRKKLSFGFQLYAQSNTPDPGTVVGTLCRSLLSNRNRYWALDAEWSDFINEPDSDEALKNNLAKAREALAGYLSDYYELSEKAGESSKMLATTTPIRLEVSEGLLPDNLQDTSPLFKTHLPKMRERIQSEMGVTVPGVRVSESAEPAFPKNYSILLDEIPIAEGRLELGMRFSPVPPAKLQELGIDELDLITADHPLTGEPGCWVEEKDWPRVKEHALELWDDPLLYMIYHLEGVLHRNLADFLNIQEFQNLLDEWTQTEPGKALVDAVVPDRSSALRVGQTLRALVKDQIPITNWEEILKTIQIVGLQNDAMADWLPAIRVSLKQQLPGNASSGPRVVVPRTIESALEQWLRSENGKTFVAIPPEACQEVVSQIRQLIESTQPNVVLVVENAKLRRFINQIVDMEFPALKVLARQELITTGVYLTTTSKDIQTNGVSADA